MAIKITTDRMVKTLSPANGKEFNIDDLNSQVGGWIEPFKVGPVWVMSAEKSKSKPLNEIASFFFDVALHGDVLVVPSQQLPRDWDLTEDEDRFFTAELVDNGFLLSLQNALMVKRLEDENPGLSIDATEHFQHHFDLNPKEEYFYSPPADETVDETTASFLGRVYEHMTKSPSQFKKGILLDENQILIRTQRENLKSILGLMKGMYVETEEYEKCAVIQKLEDQFA